jgi:hypothetical protein
MGIQRINITSDLTQFADRFDLPRVGADFFLVADRNKPVEITTGYTGGTLQQLRGEVDEYELTWDHLSLRGLVTGRDLGARLIDRPFRKIYFRFPPNPPPPFAFEVGAFTASQIAAQIASALTLTVVWDAPDYGIQENALAFSSTGADALRRLVATMGQPEMFATDVYLQDQTILVRQRKQADYIADYVLSHEELMAANITYRKRPGPIYGVVTIFGGSPTGPIIEVSGDDIAEEVEIVETDETPAAPPIKAKARTTTTKRILQSVANEVLLRETSITEVELGSSEAQTVGTPIISGLVLDSQFGIGPASDTFIFPFAASSVDGDYIGMFLTLFTPDGNRFDRNVSAYVGATRTATLDGLLTALDFPNGTLWRLDSASLPTSAPGLHYLKVAETKKVLTYDTSLLLDNHNRINIPLKKKEINEVYSLQFSQFDLILVRRESTTYDYNGDLELILQDTLIEQLENQVEVTDPHGVKRTSGGALVPFERRIVRNQRIDANQYQVSTQVFSIETVTQGLVRVIKDGFIKLVETDTKVTRGQLPGPQRVRRPHKKQIGAGGSTTNRVIKQVTISSDLDAIHVDINDGNLTDALADQLVSQFGIASGLWRHEVSIRGLALPFLTKGKVLGWSEALPEMPAPLPNALITGRQLTYVEDGQSSLYGQTLTLVWWGAAN